MAVDLRQLLVLTDKQRLDALRQELLLDERTAELLRLVAKSVCDGYLRDNYSTMDAAYLIKNTGAAQGIEQFVKIITGQQSSISLKKVRQVDESN